MDKEIYIFNDNKLNLTNGKNESIIIEKGFNITFEPPYDKALKIKTYKVTLSNATKNIKDPFMVPKDLADKLVVRSNKFTTKEVLSLFTIDEVSEQSEPLFERIKFHLEHLNKSFKKGDISANSHVVTEYVRKMSDMLNNLEEVDFHKLTKSQRESIDFFNNNPFELQLVEKNIKLNTEPYKYIKSIEEYAKSFLDNTSRWVKDKDACMVNAGLEDFIDILKISSCINYGRLYEAYDATSLDTYVREGLPEDFWNNWVSIVYDDKNILKQQQEKYKSSVAAKSHKIK